MRAKRQRLRETTKRRLSRFAQGGGESEHEIRALFGGEIQHTAIPRSDRTRPLDGDIPRGAIIYRCRCVQDAEMHGQSGGTAARQYLLEYFRAAGEIVEFGAVGPHRVAEEL